MGDLAELRVKALLHAAKVALESAPQLGKRHGDDVVSAEFRADGGAVLTASSDRSARVWNAFTGQPLTPPLWHKGAVADAVFTPDGRRVATLTHDGEVRLWDATTGEPITASLAHAHRYDAGNLSFSPDGQRLLIATGADAVFIREFPKNQAAAGELLLETQVLSGHRIEPAGGFLELDNVTLSNAWRSLRPRRGVGP